MCINIFHGHGLRTPGEEIVFTARRKINSHSQIFRYGQSIFSLPHRPKFSDVFDLCLHGVSVVRDARTIYIDTSSCSAHFADWLDIAQNGRMSTVENGFYYIP